MGQRNTRHVFATPCPSPKSAVQSEGTADRRNGFQMTAPQLNAVARQNVTLEKSPNWWDPDSECTIIVTRPSAERELWNEYVRGAETNYRKHGVERHWTRKRYRQAQIRRCSVSESTTPPGCRRPACQGATPKRRRKPRDRRMERAARTRLGAKNDRRPRAIRSGGDEDGLGMRRPRTESRTHRYAGTYAAACHDAVGHSVRHGHRGGLCTETLVVFGRCACRQDPGDTLSGPAVPDKDDVVGPKNFRQPRRSGPAVALLRRGPANWHQPPSADFDALTSTLAGR